jgi:hypothetical protein
MSPHGTGQYDPFSDEGGTDPPLDRTEAKHRTVHSPATVRFDPRSRSRSGLVHGHGPIWDGLDRPVHFKSLGVTMKLTYFH